MEVDEKWGEGAVFIEFESRWKRAMWHKFSRPSGRKGEAVNGRTHVARSIGAYMNTYEHSATVQALMGTHMRSVTQELMRV